MRLHVFLGIRHVDSPLQLFLLQLIQLLGVEKLMVVATVALKTPTLQFFLGIGRVSAGVRILVEGFSVIFINVICNVNFSFSLADVNKV
jgi:hypothetical protein